MKIVAAHVLLNIILAGIGLALYGGMLLPNWLALSWFYFAIGITFGQNLLLSSWVVFSNAAIWRKMIGCIVGFTFLMVTDLVGLNPSAFRYIDFASLWPYIMRSGGTVVFLFIARRFVLHPTRPTDAAQPVREFQFSILALLLITAGVAVVIGISRTVWQLDIHSLGLLIRITISSAVISFAMVVLLLAAIGVAASRWRLFGAVLFVSALGPLERFIMNRELSIETAAFTMSMFFVASVLVVITLLAIRSRGVRMVLIDSSLTRMFVRMSSKQ